VESESEIEIRCADGRTLAATLYGARDAGRPVAVIASATGVSRRLYGRYARFLAGRGITALTFDYRGVCGSRRGPLRDDPASLSDWGRLDLGAALDWAESELRPARLTVVAHSVGGQLLPLVSAPERIDAVVAVAAQEGYWGNWPMPLGLAFLLLCHAVMPGLVAAAGFLPAKLIRLGEDLPPGVGREWARWARTRGYMQRAPFADRLDAPALAFGFADDPLAPRRAVDRLLASQPRLVVRRRHVVPVELGVRRLGHFGFFRMDLGGSLWQESADFLLDDGVRDRAVRGAS
jgi:predicted alpha/beta hydrolase